MIYPEFMADIFRKFCNIKSMLRIKLLPATIIRSKFRGIVIIIIIKIRKLMPDLSMFRLNTVKPLKHIHREIFIVPFDCRKIYSWMNIGHFDLLGFCVVYALISRKNFTLGNVIIEKKYYLNHNIISVSLVTDIFKYRFFYRVNNKRHTYR